MYSMSYNWKSPEKSKSDILRSILNSIAKRVGRFRFSSLNTNNSISEVPVFHQAKASATEISPELKATITRMCIEAATKLTASQRNIIEQAKELNINWNESVYIPMTLSRKVKEALLQQEQSDISDLYTSSITRIEV